MKDNLSFLVQILLKKNKIAIDTDELDFQIKSHPSYPSLHAVTGVLSHFNIENLALEVPVNIEIISQLPNHFCAQITNDQGDHLVLVSKKKSNYELTFDSKDKSILTLDAFLKQFTGIIVVVEKDENHQQSKVGKKNLSKPIAFLAVALFVSAFFISKPDNLSIIHFLLSLIGVGISFLIIQHYLGIDSKLVNSICSQDSKATNCNAVLNSKGATLFNNIKLSDISLIYFTSVALSWLFLNVTENTDSTLFLISLLAIPAIGYSIYYQISIAKTWCLLCMGIVSVLTFQALLFLFEPNVLISGSGLLFVVLSFLTVTSLWLFSISSLKKEKKFEELKITSTKFKRNFDLFNTLLNKSEQINTSISNASEIVLGNKNAPLNIVVITNPFCGHCKAVHTLVENLLKGHHEDLNITIRFNINGNDTQSDVVKIANRLIEIYHEEGEEKCLLAMHDIYADNKTSLWFIKWKTSNTPESHIDVLRKEKDWCNDHRINFTPEILINGKAFPKAYERDDLIYFIEELQEVCCNENIISDNAAAYQHI